MNTASTAINFAPILEQLLQVFGLLLAGVVAWAVNKAKGYLEAQTNIKLDAQATALIETAVHNGVKYAQAQLSTIVKGTDLSVDVKHPVVAEAANYVITHVPEALARLGVTNQHLSEKILAKLPQ